MHRCDAHHSALVPVSLASAPKIGTSRSRFATETSMCMMTRSKPELVSVRIILWNEAQGLYGLFYQFNDGESFGEPWGTREETALAAAIRKQDIKAISASMR